MNDSRHISEKTMRALLARSGGYCQNPSCVANDLFPYLADGSYKSIKDAAHIIPFSDDGPRSEEVRIAYIHDFTNIILLCPTCHRTVDTYKEKFPADLLREWKTSHQARLEKCFAVPVFKTREKL